MLTKIKVLSIVILLIFVIQSNAKAKGFKAGKLDFHSQLSTYGSSANFDSDSKSFTALPNNGNILYLKSTHTLEYNSNKRTKYKAEMDFSKFKSNDGTFVRNSLKVNYLKFSGLYYLFDRPMLILPELSIKVPLVKLDPNTDSSFVESGDFNIELGAHIIKKFFGLNNYAYAGLNYRSEDYSSLFTFKAGTSKQFSAHNLGVEVNGFVTAINDTTDASTRQIPNNNANAGSMITNSVNPEVVNTLAYWNYSINRGFSIEIGYQSAFTGKNYSKGDTVFVGFQKNLNAGKRLSRRLKRKRRQQEDTFIPNE